jgi:ABC-type antimicrobial peptide transport system permease subunit
MTDATRVSKPDPDPTEATTAQLKDAIANLEGRIGARLDGMDKAILLLQKTLDKSPSIAEVDLSVSALKELVLTQFKERDVRTEQVSKSDKIAVDAALQAQKEAAGKQADNFSELINKNEQLFLTQIKSLEGKVDLLQQRIDRGEGSGEGRRQGLSDTGAFVIGAISLISLIVSVVGMFLHVGSHP